uniref:Reverse transcriptase Ty1/copia-type domain-containing protein n=1 Tax=Cannabis sativa TaxID=3483 RepID=A0A803NRT8_CANSA
MRTRSPNGILKSKAYLATKDPFLESLLPTKFKSIQLARKNPHWFASLTQVFNALIKQGTWTLVPYDKNMDVIENKGVHQVKLKLDGSLDKFKSRLVAKDYLQTSRIDYEDTFSPVFKSITIRIILSITVSNHWPVNQLDLSNAFLNSKIHEIFYMQQPPGFIDP